MHAMDLDPVIDAALGRLRGPHDVPDTTVLPAQFFPRSVVRPPERRLMMAVLARALLDLQTHAGTGTPQARRHLAAVEGWFGSDDDVWPFSFVNLCHALDLDTDAVRRRLVGWRRATRANVVRLSVERSATAWPAASRTQGLACVG
jgi:hypothetical protein